MAHPFQNIVYLQIRRRWISIRVLSWSGGDWRWEGVPEAFIVRDAKGKLVAAESLSGVEVESRRFVAFAHPRAILDNVDDTARVLELCLRRTRKKQPFLRAVFVVHVRENLEGGLADVETMGLIQVCRYAGAGPVLFANAPAELTPPEVLQLVRPRKRSKIAQLES